MPKPKNKGGGELPIETDFRLQQERAFEPKKETSAATLESSELSAAPAKRARRRDSANLVWGDNLPAMQALLAKLSYFFIVLALLSGATTQLFAQGAAFTYQGRLNDGSNPADGSYDLRFTLYDAVTNGNVIGALTNAATAVTNGLFTVTLDFGSGVFDGDARWLEIAVRTNGATGFAMLTPRQPLTPTPYAILAGTASAVASTNFAVQLAGSALNGNNVTGAVPLLASTNFIAQANAWGQTGSVASATTATTASNVSGFGVLDSTNLNNAAWLALQTSKQNQNLNFNRGRWKNTAAKIATGQMFTIELDGSGLVGIGLFDAVLTNLMTQFTFAGCRNTVGLYFYASTGGNGEVSVVGTDTNWYNAYWLMPTNTAYLTFQSGTAWNVFEVDFTAGPLGASFNIQTNLNGGAYVTVSSFTATNASLLGKSYFWTNANVQNLGIKLVQTSAGTNIICAAGAWNNTLSNAFLIGKQSASSSGTFAEVQVATNVSGPIYANWSPDIILWESIESSRATNTASLQQWVSFYTNWCPNSDIILCGTYPIPPLSTGNTGPDIILQNAIIRTNAMMFADQGWSVAYFDGSTPFIDTNNAIARGYCPLNDVHYSPAGYAAYGYFLWSWMDLAGARTYGNNYVGTFTGDGSGLTGLNPANLSAGTAAINISGNAATATNAIHATTADTATTAGMSIPMPAYNPAQRTTNYFPSLCGASAIEIGYRNPIWVSYNNGNYILNGDQDTIPCGAGQTTYIFSQFVAPLNATNVNLNVDIAANAGGNTLAFGFFNLYTGFIGPKGVVYTNAVVPTGFTHYTLTAGLTNLSGNLVELYFQAYASGTFTVSNLTMTFSPSPTNIGLLGSFARYEVMRKNIKDNWGISGYPAQGTTAANFSWDLWHQSPGSQVSFITDAPGVTIELCTAQGPNPYRWPLYIYTNGVLALAYTNPSSINYQLVEVPLPGKPTKVEAWTQFSQSYNYQNIRAIFCTNTANFSLDEWPNAKRLYVYADSLLGGVYTTNSYWDMPRGMLENLTEETLGWLVSGATVLSQAMTNTPDVMYQDMASFAPTEILLEQGFNDWRGASCDPNTFQISYGTWLDNVHLIAPAATIFCLTIPPGYIEAQTNRLGYLREDYRNAQRAAVATRTNFCVLSEGTNFFSAANLALANNDSIHYSGAGTAQACKRFACWFWNHISLSGTFSGSGNLNGTFTGNGTGLTNLNAWNLASGTIADARLSTNVALLNANQTFTGSNTFSGVITAGNRANAFNGSFTGNGSGVTNLSANAIADGLTTNFAVLVPGGGTNTLCFTNGILRAVQ